MSIAVTRSACESVRAGCHASFRSGVTGNASTSQREGHGSVEGDTKPERKSAERSSYSRDEGRPRRGRACLASKNFLMYTNNGFIVRMNG